MRWRSSAAWLAARTPGSTGVGAAVGRVGVVCPGGAVVQAVHSWTTRTSKKMRVPGIISVPPSQCPDYTVLNAYIDTTVPKIRFQICQSAGRPNGHMVASLAEGTQPWDFICCWVGYSPDLTTK